MLPRVRKHTHTSQWFRLSRNLRFAAAATATPRRRPPRHRRRSSSSMATIEGLRCRAWCQDSPENLHRPTAVIRLPRRSTPISVGRRVHSPKCPCPSPSFSFPLSSEPRVPQADLSGLKLSRHQRQLRCCRTLRLAQAPPAVLSSTSSSPSDGGPSVAVRVAC